MKKVMITGISGLLGGNLGFLFQKAGWQVCGVFNERQVAIPGVEMLSATDLQQSSFKPDVIIHCAAKTNVDESENNPESAYAVNVAFTEAIIDVANRHNALLLHISTDAVYKSIDMPKNELAPLEPLSIYAQTKLQAEEKVQAQAKQFYIIRTNLFGYNILNKASLAEWVYQQLSSGKSINGFYDVYFSPILANDLFAALMSMINSNAEKLNQVFNVGASTGVSKYAFAVKIAEHFGLDATLIQRTSVSDFGFVAPRANNSVMNVQKFETAFEHQLPTIEQGLNHFYQLHGDGYPQTLKNFNQIQYADR